MGDRRRGRYENRRLGLDDDGIAPSGVGEERNFPVLGRLSYRFDERFSLDLYGGAAFGGRFKLDDEIGHRVADADFDPTPFIALTGSLRF